MLFSSCVLAPTFPPRPPLLWMRGYQLQQGFLWTSKSAWLHSPVRSRWEILGLCQHVTQSLTAFPLYLWCLPWTTSLYKLARLWFSLRVSQFYAWIVDCPRANRHQNGKLTQCCSSLYPTFAGSCSPFKSILNGIMAATCRKSGPNQLLHLSDTPLFPCLACLTSSWAFQHVILGAFFHAWEGSGLLMCIGFFLLHFVERNFYFIFH